MFFLFFFLHSGINKHDHDVPSGFPFEMLIHMISRALFSVPVIILIGFAQSSADFFIFSNLFCLLGPDHPRRALQAGEKTL